MKWLADVGPPGEDEAEGEEDADPEAGIEVDICEGASIKKRISTLKGDANTLTHLLPHRYRNPFCESCVKAKMRHFRSKSGAFGDLFTFDPVEAAGDAENNDKYVMIIQDIYTGIIMGYPIGRKKTVAVINSKSIFGRRKIKQVYSDDAPKFINACSELKIPHDLSLPGKKQNNSLAERTNQFIVDQTTACLAHPVVVAKVPKLMRYQPPPMVQCPIGTRWLRSTWFLCGGSWEKVEDRVEPALQWERIDKYVERGVWQFHPIQPAAPARKVIQPRQRFGQDEFFQLFIQEVDGKDILDTTINSLPARILRCFKTMMRRMHAHHREQDNHRSGSQPFATC